LQRIGIGIGNSVNIDLFGLNLSLLTLSRDSASTPSTLMAGTGGQLFEQFFIKRS
jgi:hypothetical protein